MIQLLFVRFVSHCPLCIDVSGLQLRVKGHDQPFLTFDYALSPLTENLAPVDWKILVTEDVQSQNIRCHDLQAGEKLPSLVTQYQQAYAMAVILLNSEESYSLDPAFLEGGERSSYPVLVLKHSDGMRLLHALDRYEGQDVLARVDVVESTVDSQSQGSVGWPASRSVKKVNDQGTPVCANTLVALYGISVSCSAARNRQETWIVLSCCDMSLPTRISELSAEQSLHF